MFKTWDGTKKQVAREVAMGNFRSQHSAIFLPGIECRCVNMAMDKGLINLNQPLYLVEKMPSTARIIKAQLTHLYNAKYHIGELHKLKLKSLVDFAYLDCIGSMDEELYEWVKNTLIPKLSHPYRISFCFNYAWRPRVPFLDKSCERYDESQALIRNSYLYYTNSDYRIATYVCIFKELFGDSVRFVPVHERPYYQYRDNQNPMLLFTLESNCPTNRDFERLSPMVLTKSKPSHDMDTLISQYPAALKNPDKMRGWKRAKTLLCRNKAQIQGGQPEHYFRAIKAQLTRRGYDTSPLV